MGDTDAAERQDFIQGLRGVAIGVVIVFHATAWARVHGPAASWLFLGHSGVDLFFVISGFCMLWPVLAGGQVGRLSTGRFYLRRALRIGPPYLVAVAVVVAMSALMWQFGGRSWWDGQPMQSVFPTSAANLLGDLATHATFTHGFFAAYDRSIDGAFWSLATEWQFYAILPALLWVAHRFGFRVMVALTVAVPVAYTLVMRHLDPTFHVEAVPSDVIAYRLVEFGAGMVVAWLVSARRPVPVLAPATGVLLLAAFYVDRYGPPTGSPFAYAAAFGALTLLCWQSPLARRVAEWKPLLALGGISYSAYLIHGAAFMAVAVVGTNVTGSATARVGLEVVVGIPLALGGATLLHRAVERPAVTWAKAVRGVNHRPAPSAAATASIQTVVPLASTQAVPFDQIGLPRVESKTCAPAPIVDADGREPVA